MRGIFQVGDELAVDGLYVCCLYILSICILPTCMQLIYYGIHVFWTFLAEITGLGTKNLIFCIF